MNHNSAFFRRANLRGVKRIFEQKTGVALERRRFPCRAQDRKARRPAFWKTAAALAVFIALCVPVSTLAAGVPAAYDLLYAISPAAAQRLRPVRLSCESNGIRMEVLSAYIHADTAEICVSMRDLTGDRVDETTDLFDSYDIGTPFSCSAACARAGYDEATRTATLLIRVTQWGDRPIEGAKITFRVKSFLSGKKTFDDALPDVNLSKASLAPDTRRPADIRGVSGKGYAAFPEAGFTALVASGEPYSPADGVAITALGYIDGGLHIQVRYENILETDNHGTIYLQNGAGETIESATCVSFWDEARQSSYDEHVFDAAPGELEGYTLYGNFVTSDTLIQGDWAVTFPLNAERE